MVFEFAVSNGEGTLLHYGIWHGNSWPDKEFFAGAFGTELIIIMRNASDDEEPCTTGE